MHPLVRWQFIGGMKENERKAFLFTNIHDGKGRKYKMPVLVGAWPPTDRYTVLGWDARLMKCKTDGMKLSKILSHQNL